MLTKQHHSLLAAILHYDKRQNGGRGRCLTCDFPALNLSAGDRLDPSKGLDDVGAFETLQVFPARIRFWRPSRTTLVHVHCPLWDPSIGLTPVAAIAIDMLHAYYLGPLQTWCRHSLWCLIDSGHWGANEATAQERAQVTVTCIKHELFAFYSSYDRDHPGAPLSRLASLTPKMLGVGGPRKLKIKGKEAWGVGLFLLDFLQKFAEVTGAKGRALLSAGYLLTNFVFELKRCGLNITIRQQQSLLDLWKRFMAEAIPLGLVTPKCHLMYHLVMRCRWLGHPSSYHTFLDESLNSSFKAVLRLCHQANFERLGLMKLSEALSRPALRQRTR